MARRKARRSPLAVVRRVFDQNDRSNRILVLALSALLVLYGLDVLRHWQGWSFGVGLEISLRAATRWSEGGQPYLASSFQLPDGPDIPFLYPPWVLPLVAPLTRLPHELVTAAWLALTAAVSVWTCRRLSVPWLAVPLILLWRPFQEGLVTGNVQLLQLAAFVALFYVPGTAGQLTPRRVEAAPADGRGRLRPEARRDLLDGALAAGAGALKYTQLLPLLWLLRPRPWAAILGGVALAAVIVVLLPLTGIGVYWDWVAQLGRAADPSWKLAGGPLTFLIGRPLGTLVAVLAVAAMLVVRGRDAGAWVGIALVAASPSVHGYGLLFLLPVLLTLRRDLAVVLAMLLATYLLPLWWIAVGLASAALALSHWLPALRYRGSTMPDPRLAPQPEPEGRPRPVGT